MRVLKYWPLVGFPIIIEVVDGEFIDILQQLSHIERSERKGTLKSLYKVKCSLKIIN